MGPEQVLSNSLNWHPCSEPAELWVSLWVFSTCGLWNPFAAAPVEVSQPPANAPRGRRSPIHSSGQGSLSMRFGDVRTCRIVTAPPADH
jgi:hypothetical protein